MYQDYFELLDIDRDLPSWAYIKKLHDAGARYNDLYDGNIPDAVKAAVTVFGQPEGKADYDRLLELSSIDLVEIDARDIGRLKSVAEFTHFTLEIIRDNMCRVTKRSISLPFAGTQRDKDVLNSRPNPEEEAASSRTQSHSDPASAPRGKDQYGRVNGHIPPLVLGSHVYQISFTVPQYLTHVADLGECYQLMWQQDDGHSFSQRDFLGPRFGPNFYHAGATYQHVIFTDVQTRRRTTEAIYTLNAPRSAFTLSGSGIYGLFPWYAKYLPVKRGISELEYKWNEENQTMPMPPVDYFGPNGWSNQVVDIFVQYVKEVYYWGFSSWDGFSSAATKMRKLAGDDATFVLTKIMGVKQKDLKRNGL